VKPILRPSARRLAAAALLTAAACLGGCMSHTHVVGLGPTGTGETSARQYYFLFGIIRLNEVDAQRMAPELTSYSVHTRVAFVDLLLAPLLLPLTATSRTVTVRT
jgi:hypothetical protein